MACWLWAVGASALPAQDAPKNSSHVRTYPHLDEIVRHADELAAHGAYPAALEIYTEAEHAAPDTVVPVGDTAGVQSYLGLREFIRSRIASWPQEGRTAYRQKHDPSALDLFERVRREGNPESLEAIATRFPFASCVTDVLSLAADQWYDLGNSPRAAALLEKLLTMTDDAAQAPLVARLGLAYADPASAGQLRNLPERFHHLLPEVVRIGAGEQTLSDFLEALIDATPSAPSEEILPLASWPSLSGVSGSRAGDPPPSLNRLSWSTPLAPDTFGEPTDLWEPVPDTSRYLPHFPITADGVLYVSNDLSIQAFRLYSNTPDKLWSYHAPMPTGESLFDSRRSFTLTVDEGILYAPLLVSLGDLERRLGNIPVKYPFPRHALHAFDAYSGRLLWRRGGGRDGASVEDRLSFPCAPVASDDRLYVGGILQDHPTDPFKHYVLCLEASTGRTLWSTFIATGTTEINLFGNPIRASIGSSVTLSTERAFYSTHHGSVACMNRRTGEVEWINRYEQLPLSPTRQIRTLPRPAGWMNNPLIASHGLCIVAPTDSNTLYAFDEMMGTPAWKYERRTEDAYLYGVVDDTLVIGGESLVFLDLNRDGQIQAAFQPPPGLGRGHGRGFVAGRTAFLPTPTGLFRVPIDDTQGATLLRWPSTRASGGNCVSTGGTLMVASPTAVDVINAREDLEETGPELLKRHPENLPLRYRLALQYLQSGQTVTASRLLEEIFVQAPEALIGRAARRWLHSLKLAEGARALEEKDWRTAEESLSRARECAPDATAEVDAVFKIAQLRLNRGDAAGSIALLQELLDRLPQETFEGVPVSVRARDEISIILRTTGREPYAAQEKAAQELLTAARAASDPDAMLSIADHYPNSLTAADALLEAAAAHERMGETDELFPTLRRFLREYPEDSRALPIHIRLVELLENRRAYGAAAGILRRLGRLYPDESIEVEGAELSIDDFVRQRLERQDYQHLALSEELPSLSPPVKLRHRHADTEYPEGAPLPIHGIIPQEAADLVLMDYGGTVRAINLGTRAVAWNLNLNQPCLSASVVEDRLLLATESSVTCIKIETGRIEWRHLPGPGMHGFVLADHFLVYLMSDARRNMSGIAALDTTQGTLAWRHPFSGSAASEIVRLDEFLLVATTVGRLLILDLETGRPHAQATLPLVGEGIEIAAMASRRAVLHLPGRFIAACSVPEGRPLWRVNLEEYPSSRVALRTDAIAFCALSPGGSGWLMASVDPASGKVTRLRERPFEDTPRSILLDNALLLVLGEQGGGGAVTLRAYDRGTLEDRWNCVVSGADRFTLPPQLAREHILVGTLQPGANARYRYSFSLIDKAGTIVQNMNSEFEFERPPGIALNGDRVIAWVDNLADIHR